MCVHIARANLLNHLSLAAIFSSRHSEKMSAGGVGRELRYDMSDSAHPEAVNRRTVLSTTATSATFVYNNNILGGTGTLGLRGKVRCILFFP